MEKLNEAEITAMKPKDFRDAVRKGEYTGISLDACQGFAHANLVILPKEYAFEFLLFCTRNPIQCPVLEVLEAGDPVPRKMANDADLRTDLPRYRIYEKGKLVAEPTKITEYWRKDLVTFLIGCGWSVMSTFPSANITAWRRFGLYRTKVSCVPAGRLHGPMVVVILGFDNASDAIRAIQITSRYPLFHGPPVHIGDPTYIGVDGLGQPDSFNPRRPILTPKPGEIIVSWACAVTPQTVIIESGVPFAITDCPAHVFVTDRLVEELAVL